LRELADGKGVTLGVFIDPRYYQPVSTTETIISENFNLLVTGALSWDWIRRKGRDINLIDFALNDRWVALAQRHNMKIRNGNHLIYHFGLPDWLTSGNFTRTELISIMQEHITTVIGHYKGIVSEWIVVNEAVWSYRDKTGYTDDVFYKTIGSDYIEMAFQSARQADPNAVLIYNDFGDEIAGLKADVVYGLVKRLKDKNLVDAVGMQFHIMSPPVVDPVLPHVDALNLPSKSDFITQMRRYRDIGVKVVITELDVDISQLAGTLEQKLARQAEIYRMVLEVCLESGACNSLSVWGLNDEGSWIESIGGKSPLLFSKGEPKPAYFAIRDVLANKP
jgi:endo-1,4-beta-xylanase